MRLQPYGRLVPVHCCCEPTKRLGWVPAPEKLGPVKFALGRPTRSLTTGLIAPLEIIETEIAWLVNYEAYHTNAERFMAVKSNDIPIEQWRRIPGFVEEPAR